MKTKSIVTSILILLLTGCISNTTKSKPAQAKPATTAAAPTAPPVASAPSEKPNPIAEAMKQKLASCNPKDKPVSMFVVRHPEDIYLGTPPAQPAEVIPLHPVGVERAKLIKPTFRHVKFTHIFASHTYRSKQTVQELADAQGLQVVQLPTPGTMYEGKLVNDALTRKAAVEPMATQILKLPPGSVPLVVMNRDNLWLFLNKLGIPLVQEPGKCQLGDACVPCFDKECFPGDDYDHYWHIILSPCGEILDYKMLYFGSGWAMPPELEKTLPDHLKPKKIK